MDIQGILQSVKDGSLSVEAASGLLKDLPYEDLGFAKLDHHRQLRSGFGEVIYCAGKSVEHTVSIFSHFAGKGSNVLGTRASEEQAQGVLAAIPGSTHDPVSRTVSLITKPVEPLGLVAVCTGGTSDIPVAEEAAVTAEFFGAKVDRIYDVGVAGIHRLLSQLDRLRSANAIVAVAGMEGALAGVVAGLVDIPVVAVPTSVGYGASFGGVSALLTMLNSCAEGIGVVNIDNGFGAGHLACQINRLACGRKGENR
ncbi:nickel pincer cofactor biosynthesis protein LarB [Oscillospiraceae bacterium MB08-C2-2]|nr:nickel pincer cofactor biosynthesis protein LarB [Oscillospiraceae bacterium MB08-C2-2]